jgi:hypothetical protein
MPELTRRSLLWSSAGAAAALGQTRGADASPSGVDLVPLRRAMASARFVAYQPTGIQAIDGKVSNADEASIRSDLVALKPYFDGLITYSAINGAERVPDVALELGFRAVILGVWDIYNKTELANAVAAFSRKREIVAGCSLGNEIVLSKRGTWGDLGHTLNFMHAEAPGLPLTTTEPFSQFLTDPDAVRALGLADFMLVNIHPIFEPWFHTAAAPNWADFVARVVDNLAGLYRGPVIVKETGVPSGPKAQGFDPAMQHDFWRALEARMPRSERSAFAYFCAFDLPWREFDGAARHPEEAHWGLFTEQREPKPVIADLARLRA